jgi:UDP-N-acetylglucosamine--N-acetylmuramyl-(pentapeptide) pyrophosphoryl-undecaprenol N-acetylglucosamine transferase
VTSSAGIAVSALRAWRWLGAERPDAVIGFGGYVSVPVGLAAVLRGIPLVLHEQNSVPGLANRVLSRWASVVGVTYEESLAGLARPERAVLTGNPVRPEVLTATRAKGRRAMRVDEDATLLLVFGGSRGARHLNNAIIALSTRLAAIDGLTIALVAGPSEAAAVTTALEGLSPGVRGAVRVFDYVSDMGSAIAAADLVVARAGATSIAELTALGAPCVLVPYPFATDDHQTTNAAAMVAHGAAVLVADSDLDGERFGDELVALIEDPERRATMSAASRALGRPDAGHRVASIAREAAATSQSRRG